MFCDHDDNSPSLVSILNPSNTVPIFKTCIFKIHRNIILLDLRSSFFSSDIHANISYAFLISLRVLHIVACRPVAK
jgi:hypothetical protein